MNPYISDLDGCFGRGLKMVWALKTPAGSILLSIGCQDTPEMHLDLEGMGSIGLESGIILGKENASERRVPLRLAICGCSPSRQFQRDDQTMEGHQPRDGRLDASSGQIMKIRYFARQFYRIRAREETEFALP